MIYRYLLCVSFVYATIARLALSLLIPGIFLVDHIQFTVTSDDLAVSATLLDGCFNFHVVL